MNKSVHVLPFGDKRSQSFLTEADYVSALISSKRPVSDISFKTRRRIVSRTTSIKLGGLIIAAACGSPAHARTLEDPQYSIILPVSGHGTLRHGRKSVALERNKLIRSSYDSPLSYDYEDYSIISIRVDPDRLAAALGIAEGARGRFRQRLLEAGTDEFAASCGSFDMPLALEAILAMIDGADGDAAFLERIGVDSLLMNLIAEFVRTQETKLLDA